MTDLTPEQIVTMREEIARMLCARNTRFIKYPYEDPLQISNVDLQAVTDTELQRMVLAITPRTGSLQ